MMLLLEAIESPFADLRNDATIAPADLVLALSICAGAKWPFAAPRLRATLRMRWLAYRLMRDQTLFEQACASFVGWISACSGSPEFWQDEGGSGRSLTAPTVLAYSARAMRTTTLTEARVWSMPVGLLAWYAGAAAEQESDAVRFFYDHEISEENQPPDLSKLSDEELYDQAVKDLGEAAAQAWLQRRKEARNGK